MQSREHSSSNFLSFKVFIRLKKRLYQKLYGGIIMAINDKKTASEVKKTDTAKTVETTKTEAAKTAAEAKPVEVKAEVKPAEAKAAAPAPKNTEEKKPAEKKAEKKVAEKKPAEKKAPAKKTAAKTAKAEKPAAKTAEKAPKTRAPRAPKAAKLSPYQAAVAKAQKKFSTIKTALVKYPIAVNFELNGSAEGVFYVYLSEAGKPAVEPYRYDDYDVYVRVDADAFDKILDGKLDVYQALAEGSLHVEGTVKKALMFFLSAF